MRDEGVPRGPGGPPHHGAISNYWDGKVSGGTRTSKYGTGTKNLLGILYGISLLARWSFRDNLGGLWTVILMKNGSAGKISLSSSAQLVVQFYVYARIGSAYPFLGLSTVA